MKSKQKALKKIKELSHEIATRGAKYHIYSNYKVNSNSPKERHIAKRIKSAGGIENFFKESDMDKKRLLEDMKKASKIRKKEKFNPYVGTTYTRSRGKLYGRANND